MEYQRTELSGNERKKLADTLVGYSNLTQASKKTGLHINTLRLVNLKGYGKRETIEAIRMHLIGYEDRVVSTNIIDA